MDLAVTGHQFDLDPGRNHHPVLLDHRHEARPTRRRLVFELEDERIVGAEPGGLEQAARPGAALIHRPVGICPLYTSPSPRDS